MLEAPPEPWRSFLIDLDRLLESTAGTPTAELHCLGGFVVAMCHDLTRPTGDIDVFSVVPGEALRLLLEHAGEGRPLAKRHGIYIDANSRVATLPHHYEDRLSEIFPGQLAKLRLFVPDRYDLALSKLERNIDRDREDILLLAGDEFDVEILQKRYVAEVRPFVNGPPTRHDLTLELWLDMIRETRQAVDPSSR